VSRRRLLTLERVGDDLRLRSVRLISTATEFSIGRGGDVTIATDPPDDRVSRVAAIVVPTADGWRVEPRNTNGTVLHLWAQAPRPLARRETVTWPRIGLRFPGTGDRHHWVLLEDNEIYTEFGPPPGMGTTEIANRPQPLTDPQRSALRAVFDPVLAWPPPGHVTFPTFAKAARQLGCAESSLKERLAGTMAKAQRLGFTGSSGLNTPEYLYLLVRCGYLTPDDADVHPLIRLEREP
jgi:hypothetical protein